MSLLLIRFFDIFIERGLRDAHHPADLVDGVFSLTIQADRQPALGRSQPSWPAGPAPFGSGSIESGPCPLAIQISLELRKRVENRENRLAAVRGRVDRLL